MFVIDTWVYATHVHIVFVMEQTNRGRCHNIPQKRILHTSLQWLVGMEHTSEIAIPMYTMYINVNNELWGSYC